MANGIISIDKPQGWTSQDVTARLRRVFNTRRIGHGGTLDPMATGVLPVFVGRATRGVEFFEHAEKTYETTLRLGITTDTEDITGTVLSETAVNVTEEEFLAVLPRFRGEIMQVPPMYSALKVNGQKLYDLARRGREVERQPRPITIHRLECLEFSGNEARLRVCCSKGTYIRTLCKDIGEALGCGGCMAALRRTQAGEYSIADSVPLEKLLEESEQGLDVEHYLKPVDSMFAGTPAITLTANQAKRIRNGNSFSHSAAPGKYRVYSHEGEFLALVQVNDGVMSTIKSFFEVRPVMRKGKRVFALGFFDGVHRGHQALVHACRELAEELDCKSAALTFDTHPDGLVLGKAPVLINTVQDRRLLLRSFGIGPIYTLPFDQETMTMPWQDFFRLLLTEYGAAGIVCGDDFRFGHRGEGDAEKLRAACDAAGIPCVVVPEQRIDGIRISSTHIRELIENGQMEEAVQFLGHPHILTGPVVPGRHLGHKLGFPTANVLLPDQVICPRHGVYACKVEVSGKQYQAVTNVGSRPTVEGHQVRTESWILDFDGDLYGEEITLSFHAFLRPEQRFDTLEALKAAVERDAESTREYFEKI